jgi:hypothetical protein
VWSVCSVVKKNGIVTQPQDHLPNWIGLLHQFIDHFAGYKLVDLHELFCVFTLQNGFSSMIF